MQIEIAMEEECVYLFEMSLLLNPGRININVEKSRAEILLPNSLHILIGMGYRPPNQYDFFDMLEQSCHQADIRKHDIIIICLI